MAEEKEEEESVKNLKSNLCCLINGAHGTIVWLTTYGVIYFFSINPYFYLSHYKVVTILKCYILTLKNHAFMVFCFPIIFAYLLYFFP